MDWSRAKNYLIIAFLLLDLMLGQQLWAGARGFAWTGGPLARPVSRDLEDLARRDGIVLKGKLPNHPATLPMLRVRFAHMEPEQVADAFLDRRQGVESMTLSGSLAGMLYRRGGENLTVLEKGWVLYERPAVVPGGPGRLDPVAAQRMAGDFLRGLGTLFTQVVPDLILPAGVDPPVFQVFYVQRFRDWPLFSGSVAMEVAGGGVRTLQSVTLEPLGTTGRRLPVRPAVEALQKLKGELVVKAGMPLEQKLLVEQVDLGYYSPLEKWAEEWEIPAVWRIVTKDGQVFFINASSLTWENPPEESAPTS